MYILSSLKSKEIQHLLNYSLVENDGNILIDEIDNWYFAELDMLKYYIYKISISYYPMWIQASNHGSGILR